MIIRHDLWTRTELLEQNRQRLLIELANKLRTYEARYELSSDLVEAELSGGRLRETAEICDWVVALRAYRALEHG